MIKKLKFVNNLKTKAVKIGIAYSLISHKHLRTTKILSYDRSKNTHN